MFYSHGPEKLAVFETKMNSTSFPTILESPSVQRLKLGRDWVVQQDNDPKHSRTAKEEKQIKVLESQNPEPH